MQKRNFDLGFFYSYRGVVDKTDNGEDIYGFNFNPYITDKDGNKVYFQRDLCWTLENKRDFIDALYNEMNCGDIILRYNSFNRRNIVKAEFDVVDGKQRLTTLIDFFNNEFSDNNGYYWKDFSEIAQRFFKSKVNSLNLFYIEDTLDEKTVDTQVKQAFINVNFCGVAMSKEHIEFVKSINV